MALGLGLTACCGLEVRLHVPLQHNSLTRRNAKSSKKMDDPFVMGILSCLNSLPNCLTAVKYLPFYIGTHMLVWLLRAYAVLY